MRTRSASSKRRRAIVAIAFTSAVVALSACGDASTGTSVKELAAGAAATPVCDDLAYVREHWNIKAPEPNWVKNLQRALGRAATKLPAPYANDAIVVSDSLDFSRMNFGEVGVAQRRLDDYSLDACGVAVFD